MNKTIIASFLSAVTLMSSAALGSVGSIGIDAMIKFANQGETSFSVTNSAEYRQFIQVAITELMVKDGQIDSKKRDIHHFDAHEFDGKVISKQDMIVYLDEHRKSFCLLSLTPL